MTRFELAGALSEKLYILAESERHSIIDRYVNDINMKIEEGADEADAIEQLGDVDLLADRILARYHIDTGRVPKKSTPECDENESFPDTFPDSAKEEISEEKTNKTNTATGRFLSWISKSSEHFVFNILNLIIFIFLYIPCMMITALGIICTAAVTLIFIMSGIGFWGVCIAGAGCCIVGISFCLWLGNVLTGGKKNEQNI